MCSVCTLNTQNQKKGTYAQSLMPFESFIILTVGKTRTITVAQDLLSHSVSLTLRKSGLGRKEDCFPHYTMYPQPAILSMLEIFFPLLQALQDRRLHHIYQNTALAPAHKYCVHPGSQHYCSILKCSLLGSTSRCSAGK